MTYDNIPQGEIDVSMKLEIYRNLGTPGKPHALLEGMTGDWNAHTQTFMETGAPPMESTGTCARKMVLDGRYLQEEYHGKMMGVPFTGISVTGFDNHTQKFVSTWMDSLSTAIFYFTGRPDSEGRTITQECRYDDPIKGPMTMRSVTRIVDHDTHEFEMYGVDRSGHEEKMMAITYTRKK